MNNFFDFTGRYIDDYIPDNKLVQCYEYNLSPTAETGIEGEKWVIICYNLILNGNFTNWGGEITIFCKNIICRGQSTLDVSGKDSTYPAGKKGQPEGDQKDGVHADNKINGIYIGDELKGKNGGNITIYAQNISGELILKANGGNGAKGQEGGDAVKGVDGAKGPKIYISNETLEEAKFRAAGEDGGLPTSGGWGAQGGNGGIAGKIEIYSLNWNLSADTIHKYVILNSGKGGYGGAGGKENYGGDGGEGGEIWDSEDYEKPSGGQYYYEWLVDIGLKGVSYLESYGDPGSPGGSGKTMPHGTPIIDPLKSLSFASNLTVNYFRSLILQAEDYYLNNDINSACEIFGWMLEIENYLKENTNAPVSSPSVYYNLFTIQDFESYFSKAKIYLNQINQGADFFGNFPNYTTLLDESFLDTTILNYKNSIVSYEALLDEALQKDNSIIVQITGKNEIKNGINTNLNLLRQENAKLSDVIKSLNDEILSRLAEADVIKMRINELEYAFKKAVEDATNGCTLQDALNTVTKLVSIGVAISSGIGAIGAGAAVLTDTGNLIEDFKTKYEKIDTGFPAEKWKAIVEEGQNADPSKDTSIIKQVEKIQKSGGDFTKDVKAIGEAYNSLKEKKSAVVTIPTVDVNNAANKQKFIEQMKEFVSKYDEARVYQEEVIHFFDYCDLTNQKRLQFSNTVLQMMKNTEDIFIYEKDINEINSTLLSLNDNKLSSYSKTVIIDTYLKLRKNYIKLIYLQKKSIDFLLLKNSPFSLNFYNGKIDAIDSNYLTNKSILIDALENSTASSLRSNIDIPYEISEKTHPVSFRALKKSKFKNNSDFIYFNFRVSLDTMGLDHIREIKLFSVRIYFIGAKTSTGNIGFSLKHLGDSVFVTRKNEIISFNHHSIIKPLQYPLGNEKVMYTEFFNKSKSQYYSAEIKNDYYVGISPFANWAIYIPNRSINKDLDLSNLEKIEIVFEYECQAEEF